MLIFAPLGIQGDCPGLYVHDPSQARDYFHRDVSPFMDFICRGCIVFGTLNLNTAPNLIPMEAYNGYPHIDN
jgi:hypothetical protein